MSRRASLDLGPTTEDKERRLAAFQAISDALGVYGRTGVPSASEVLRRLADAYENNPVVVLAAMKIIIGDGGSSQT